MRVEVLYFDGCASWQKAVENLRVALQEEGVEAEIQLVRVDSPEEAIAKRFVGSPTLRIDGEDIEGPGAEEKGYQFGCRIYFDQGQPLGWPSVELIRAAIRRARQRTRKNH